jgi:ribosome-associated protein
VPASDQARDIALVAAQAAADKKAQDIRIIDVGDQMVITDIFLLASAPNERQVLAIVDEIEEKLRQIGEKPARREGARGGRWVLLDYIDVVVHVQHVEEREFYALDRLWKDCPLIPFTDRDEPAAVGSRGTAGSGSEAGGA